MKLYKGECIGKHKKHLEKVRVRPKKTWLVLFDDVSKIRSINLKTIYNNIPLSI